MNRIYQGRVSRVEVLKPGTKGRLPEDWQPLPDWESKLWAHHELFQDAVNYYTLALAAMAEGVESDTDKAKAARGWREQVRETWRTARRKAVVFPGPHSRVALHLGLDSAATGFDECAAQVMGRCRADLKTRADAFLRLLELANQASDLSPFAVEKLPWLCDPDTKRKSDDTAKSEKRLAAQAFAKRLHAATPSELFAVASDFSPALFVQATRCVSGTAAKDCLLEYFSAATERAPELASLTKEFDQLLDSLKPEQDVEVAAKRYQGEFPLAVLFKCWPAQTVVVNAFKRATLNLAAGKELSGLHNDPLREIRGDQDEAPFSYFSNIVFSRPAASTSRAAWFELDLAAFIEAIKAPHRYFQDTQKRESVAADLRRRLAALEGRGGALDDESEEDEESANAAGFTGDSRIDLLVELVFQQLYVGEADESESGASVSPFIRESLARRGIELDPHRQEYTIQERTLRGFADILKRWRELVAQGHATEERLLAVLVDEQGKHRDDFGSASLYRALAQPRYQPIWREAGSEKWHADDPLKAWRAYTELRFELADKTRAIRFTPAHAKHSPRYFILPKSGRHGTEHQAGELALTCGMTLNTEQGLQPRAVRLFYSAPRLCRDGLRAPGDTDLAAVAWIQPMMQALGLPEPDLQGFSNCRVTLQPAAPDNIQLTFPVEIVAEKLQRVLGHKDRWSYQPSGNAGQKNFAQFNYSASEPRSETSLRWPSDIEFAKRAKQSRKREPDPWHEKLNRFSCLATDLGQRDAGAFALVEARANDGFAGKPSRFIGETPGKRWQARLVASGLFRLSGEDRREWRAPSPAERSKGASEVGWREELWGERGRAATDVEKEECARLLRNFGLEEKGFLPDDWRNALSFPEQNDKLLVAARRAQSRTARLHRWCWFLTDPKHAAKTPDVLKEIAELGAERLLPDAIQHIAASGRQDELLVALRSELKAWSDRLPPLLETLANRCVPLRGRSWKWGKHPQAERCFLLSQAGPSRPNARRENSDGSVSEVTWIRGQRGLSFERIEQIEELRKRFQSLNQTLRRLPGEAPLKRRDDSIPDPCPDLLEKLDVLKEQRVNQTAHMILAEALGVRLAPPPVDKPLLRANKDQHGVYERVREPVDFIVIEDLSRYRASQGRAPRENSRLMKWSHRAVRDKLKQLCEVFGLPVLETPAAYSSRFCSRSGVPGFRVDEVTAGFTKKDHWAWLAAKKDEQGRPQPDAQRLLELDALLEQAQRELERCWKAAGRSRPCPKRTLLVPRTGGAVFVPVSEKADGADLAPAIAQADINAAINLALRAIADPRLWSIHPRLRTQREGDGQPKKRSKRKVGTEITATTTEVRLLSREKRKFGESGVPLAVQRAAEAKSDGTWQPNFFADLVGLRNLARQLESETSREYGSLEKEWTTAEIVGMSAPALVHGKSFWGCVKAAQWRRVHAINAARLAKWQSQEPVPNHPEL